MLHSLRVNGSIRLIVLSLTIVALAIWFAFRAAPSRPAASSTPPTLQGDAAIAALKQQGRYGSLNEAVIAAQYNVHALGGVSEFVSTNPAHNLRAEFSSSGLTVETVAAEQRHDLTMSLRSVGYGKRQLRLGAATITAEGQRVEYTRSLDGSEKSAIGNPQSAMREWLINRPSGLEQGFTIAEPLGRRRSGEALRLVLELGGDLRARAMSDGQAAELVDRQGNAVLHYDHLLTTDAHGQKLPSKIIVKGQELRLEVKDAKATYPITIDPTITQQAYLKASNTGALDDFGNSVSISGDTVVVGAATEDSNATGVNGDGGNNLADNSGAAYVFVRSGTMWAQQAYLKASNSQVGDGFGWAVGISGDTVVVSARSEDSNATGVNGNESNNSASESGAVYVFVRSGTTWSQQAYLKASNTGANDNFGTSVAIFGNTVVVGAYAEDSNALGVNGDGSNNLANNSGAAYVFVRSGTTWSQQAYLKASNTEGDDQFGWSVAGDGDTVVVGAYIEDSNATGVNGDESNNLAPLSGAAYVFVRSGTSWSQQAYLKPSNTEGNDRFTWSVAASGDTIVVGAPGEDSNATVINGDGSNNSAPQAGAAYVFVRSGTSWSQQAYLKASNAKPNHQFGMSAAISDDAVVIGAPFEGNSLAPDSGAAYVFVRSGATWAQQAYLKASNIGAADRFGIAVANSDDTVAVGAFGEDSSATGVNGDQSNNSLTDPGAAYIFVGVGIDLCANVTCSPLDQCHEAGACDPSTGMCLNPLKPDGAACSDGDVCTQTDTCQAGVCTGSNPVACTASDACHTAGICDPSTGMCSNPVTPDGSSCDDFNFCTRTDTCQAGACIGSNPVICTALDQCHVAGACSPNTGTCDNPAAPNGTACSDGNACTQSDTCQTGSCSGGPSANCDDHSACTADSCDAATGCAHSSINCEDNNPCTTDSCDPASGCVHLPVSCDDGNACTADSCDPANGCLHAPINCNDNNACTADSCNPATGCVNTSISCDDGNACTADSCDAVMGCSHTAISCDDGNACTTDSCSPSSGCVHAPVCTNPVQTGFVIGDLNAVVGNQVMFWGAQWAKNNSLSGGAAPSGFKGFTNSTNPSSPTCGGTWKSDPGNSSGPPATVPQYIIVLVASSATKSGAIVSGNMPTMVVIKTDPGYDANPGHAGTGTVVSIVCGTTIAELNSPTEPAVWQELYWSLPARALSWFAG